jgi:hypothetical protein
MFNCKQNACLKWSMAYLKYQNYNYQFGPQSLNLGSIGIYLVTNYILHKDCLGTVKLELHIKMNTLFICLNW